MRRALLLTIMVAGIALVVWSGVQNYKHRTAQPTQVTLIPDTPSASGSSSDSTSPSPLRGKPAPPFTLVDLAGKKVSLNDFKGDEQGESAAADFVAKYNGLTPALRPTSTFDILPFDTVSEAPTRGAHARSWARFEAGQLVLLALRPAPPGEEAALAMLRAADPRVKGLVQASAPVVVASKTSESIERSSSLAVVPYGGGEIVLRRRQGERAEIVSHYFGGATASDHAAIQGGQLKLAVRTHNREGNPLEWLEIKIS